VRNIPEEIRWISSLLPATHYIQIVRNSILRDVGWETSYQSVLMLLALAFAFFMLNVIQMRKMQFQD
jgi:ABC-type polysaccharide/polyol phosphate export permease